MAMTTQRTVTSTDLRARFAARLSRLYASEVPLYETLVEVSHEVNERVLCREGGSAERLGSITRVTAERHGAIRVGSPTELAQVARIFGALGMHPCGLFPSELLVLADRACEFGELSAPDADRFLELATGSFALSSEPVDRAWYADIRSTTGASRAAAVLPHVPTVSGPAMRPSTEASACRASCSRARMRSAYDASTRPESVSTRSRPDRATSGDPTAFSSADTCCETAPGVYPRTSAAAASVPWRTKARKVVSWVGFSRGVELVRATPFARSER